MALEPKSASALSGDDRRGQQADVKGLSTSQEEAERPTREHDASHPLVLACAADDRYGMPMAIMLYSALRNYRGPWRVEVYILDAGLSLANQERIRRVLAPFGARVHWLSPDAGELQDLPLGGYLTTSTYYRVLIPELTPMTVRKAIYLDSDTLVLGDLARLWQERLGDNYFLAAQDRKKLIGSSLVASCPALSSDLHKEYFNAGVLVMHLSRLREDRVSSKVFEFSRRWRTIVPGSNPGMNAVAIGKWGKLDSLWNQYVPKSGDFSLKPDGILHYVGSGKPWRPDKAKHHLPNDIGAAYRLWDEYALRSGWFKRSEWISQRFARTYHRYRRLMRQPFA